MEVDIGNVLARQEWAMGILQIIAPDLTYQEISDLDDREKPNVKILC